MAVLTQAKVIDETYMRYKSLAERPLRSIIFSDMDMHSRVPIIGQLVESVAHIHDKGVMHRDNKPENIVVISSKPLEIQLSTLDPRLRP